MNRLNEYTFPTKRTFLTSLLILALTILLSNPSIHILSAQQAQNKLELIWAVTGREGWTRSTCTSGLAVYIVGTSREPTGWVGTIEARDINTGELLRVWKSPATAEFTDCIVMGDYLYVVGVDNFPGNWEWYILKFTLDLNLVEEKHYNPTSKGAKPLVVNTDGKYLYIGGFDNSTKNVYYPDDSQCHVIKMDPDDLSVLKSYTLNPSNYLDYVLSIAISPVGEIWLAIAESDYAGMIIILNQDLTQTGSTKIDNFARPTITFDESGYAYITSSQAGGYTGGGLLKLSPDLKIIKSNKMVKGDKIIYHGGYLYIAVEYYVSDYRRHVLVQATKDLDIIETLVLSSNVDTDAYFFSSGKMDVVDDKIFVPGYYYFYDTRTYRWAIYSIKTTPLITTTTPTTTIATPTTSPTTTVTITVTIPVTTTVTKTETSTRTITETQVVHVQATDYMLRGVIVAVAIMIIAIVALLIKLRK